MRLTSLLGRGTEGQIENLDIQERQITNLPGRNDCRDGLFSNTTNRVSIRPATFICYMKKSII